MRGGTKTSRSLASEEPVVDALDLSNGEAGRRVVENGEGAVGGGRWMKVRQLRSFSSSMIQFDVTLWDHKFDMAHSGSEK